MESSKILAERFKEVILDGKWIANTNCMELLADITLQEANNQIASLNTIAALTFHINYYIEGILNLFNGGDLEIRDKFSFDAPRIETEEQWNEIRERLEKNSIAFAQHVEGMSAEKLSAAFVKKEYGNYRRNIEGMIEHSYYHMGQIALLKKLIRA